MELNSKYGQVKIFTDCPQCGEVLEYDKYRDRWYCYDCGYKSKRKPDQNKSRQRKSKEKNRYQFEQDDK